MKRCPITYQSIKAGRYSQVGLKQISRKLSDLKELPYNLEEFKKEYINRAGKLSIQGVQPKLSAKLSIPNQQFELVDKNGKFILKPQNSSYPELPENEDLTMKMAKICGIETPWHGLIWSKENQLCYMIKRFDRKGHNSKLALEDFAQLSQKKRVTKYQSSLENVVSIIDQFTTFPILEKHKLLRLTIFNYLVGNEDMHLKNFSLITRNDKVELSPAYDLLNTTIAIENPIEEIALPIVGKKSKLKLKHFTQSLAKERMKISENKISNILEEIEASLTNWKSLISISFLSDEMQQKYQELLEKRVKVIFG